MIKHTNSDQVQEGQPGDRVSVGNTHDAAGLAGRDAPEGRVHPSLEGRAYGRTRTSWLCAVRVCLNDMKLR